MNRKLDEITCLVSLGITLVMVGHSYPAVSFVNDSAISFLFKFVYSFHMPLFMFISGLLFIYSTRDIVRFDYITFISKKIKRLLVPYFFISSLAFPVKALFSSQAYRPIELSFRSYVGTILFPWSNTIIFFWFLPTLFLIFLIAPFLRDKAICGHKNLHVLLTLVILVLYLAVDEYSIPLMNLSGAMSYLIFFWLGCLYCLYKGSIESYFEKRLFLFFSIVILIALVSFDAKIGFLSFLRACVGIAMSISLSKYLVRRKIRIFSFIDHYSYQIYLLSWFFSTGIRIVFFQLLGLGLYPTAMLMFVAGLFLPVYLAKFIEKQMPSMKVLIGL